MGDRPVAAWLWRGGAKTLSICFISTICLSAFLYTPARSTESATCEELLRGTLFEFWGLPLPEEQAALQALADGCAGAESPPARSMTLKGLWDYAGGRYEMAAQAWTKGADLGDPLSMVLLGDASGRGLVSGGDLDQRREASYDWYRKAAEKGSPLGMSKLALYYDHGYHVDEDPEKALTWYMAAAEAGEPSAMHNVAYHFAHGRGISPDVDLAIRWYKWAGEAGVMASYHNLAVLYDEGREVPKDDAKAVYYYRLAAYGGYPDAMHNLAWMYKHGAGVERDYAEAVYWYERALDSGLEVAASNLGVMYYQGLGVDQDTEKALSYFLKAANAGRAEAMGNVSTIYMDSGVYPEAYFWTVLAIVHGLTDLSFRLVELQRLLPETTLAAIESHADSWAPGSPMPDLASLRR